MLPDGSTELQASPHVLQTSLHFGRAATGYDDALADYSPRDDQRDHQRDDHQRDDDRALLELRSSIFLSVTSWRRLRVALSGRLTRSWLAQAAAARADQAHARMSTCHRLGTWRRWAEVTRAVVEEGRRADGQVLWAALRRWRVQSRALGQVHDRSREARLALLWPQLRSLAVRRTQQLAVERWQVAAMEAARLAVVGFGYAQDLVRSQLLAWHRRCAVRRLYAARMAAAELVLHRHARPRLLPGAFHCWAERAARSRVLAWAAEAPWAGVMSVFSGGVMAAWRHWRSHAAAASDGAAVLAAVGELATAATCRARLTRWRAWAVEAHAAHAAAHAARRHVALSLSTRRWRAWLRRPESYQRRWLLAAARRALPNARRKALATCVRRWHMAAARRAREAAAAEGAHRRGLRCRVHQWRAHVRGGQRLAAAAAVVAVACPLVVASNARMGGVCGAVVRWRRWTVLWTAGAHMERLRCLRSWRVWRRQRRVVAAIRARRSTHEVRWALCRAWGRWRIRTALQAWPSNQVANGACSGHPLESGRGPRSLLRQTTACTSTTSASTPYHRDGLQSGVAANGTAGHVAAARTAAARAAAAAAAASESHGSPKKLIKALAA